jgi:hypothetical protein
MTKQKEIRVQISNRLYRLVPAEKCTIKTMSDLIDKFDIYFLSK